MLSDDRGSPITCILVLDFARFVIREPNAINEYIYIPDIYKALGNPKWRLLVILLTLIYSIEPAWGQFWGNIGKETKIVTIRLR